MEKTFYVENLGCFRNQVDAEYIVAAMEQAGYTQTQDAATAAAIVVNTCGFIESAKEESINTFFELRTACPQARIILAGCLAQRYGKELLEMIPEADGVFGNRAPELLPEIMDRLEKGEKVSYFPKELGTAPRRARLMSSPRSAFLKVAEGCVHRCSFCAIPGIRGPLVSRGQAEVLAEFDDLLARGIFEFNLIAQDLASYGYDRRPGGELIELLKAMLTRPGHFWIRPFYIHPDTFPREILELCATDSRLLPYFDLPFQHGEERILKLMGRSGSKEGYLDLVADIRKALPEAVLRSTFLVGFPSENRKDLEVLTGFQAQADLDWAGVFAYSREEDTQAYGLQDDKGYAAGKGERTKRKTIVEQRQAKITEARLKRWVGIETEVLVEEPMEGTELILGRAWFQAPEVDGLMVVHCNEAAMPGPGDLIRVRITAVRGVDLEATCL